MVRALRRRRSGDRQLLAYRVGRSWRPLRSDEINEYLKLELGEEFSAKDFRTWNATVMAAVALGADGLGASSKSARKRAIDAPCAQSQSCSATRQPSHGAPTSIRACSTATSRAGRSAGRSERLPELDPANDRVRARIEAAVLDLLAENSDSPALARV